VPIRENLVIKGYDTEIHKEKTQRFTKFIGLFSLTASTQSFTQGSQGNHQF